MSKAALLSLSKGIGVCVSIAVTVWDNKHDNKKKMLKVVDKMLFIQLCGKTQTYSATKPLFLSECGNKLLKKNFSPF